MYVAKYRICKIYKLIHTSSPLKSLSTIVLSISIASPLLQCKFHKCWLGFPAVSPEKKNQRQQLYNLSSEPWLENIRGLIMWPQLTHMTGHWHNQLFTLTAKGAEFKLGKQMRGNRVVTLTMPQLSTVTAKPRGTYFSPCNNRKEFCFSTFVRFLFTVHVPDANFPGVSDFFSHTAH